MLLKEDGSMWISGVTLVQFGINDTLQQNGEDILK